MKLTKAQFEFLQQVKAGNIIWQPYYGYGPACGWNKETGVACTAMAQKLSPTLVTMKASVPRRDSRLVRLTEEGERAILFHGLKAATIKNVNELLTRAGINGEIVNGNGYFYFVGPDFEACKGTSVYCNNITDCELYQWLELAQSFARESAAKKAEWSESESAPEFDGDATVPVSLAMLKSWHEALDGYHPSDVPDTCKAREEIAAIIEAATKVGA